MPKQIGMCAHGIHRGVNLGFPQSKSKYDIPHAVSLLYTYTDIF